MAIKVSLGESRKIHYNEQLDMLFVGDYAIAGEQLLFLKDNVDKYLVVIKQPLGTGTQLKFKCKK